MPANYIKKIVFISAFVMTWGATANAQGNLPYVDEKLFHFGFSLGFNSMNFGVTPSNDSIDGKVYKTEVSTLQPGFSVGIIGDMRLSRYLNLRCTPTLHFGSRTLQYTADNGATFEKTSVSSIPIALPLYLKYSAERKNNYRPYLICGGGAAIDLGVDNTKDVVLKPLDFFTEFGVGCDIYFSFFKLCPELKFALGFNNVLSPLEDIPAENKGDERDKFTQALSKLTSRMVTLTFNFE